MNKHGIEFNLKESNYKVTLQGLTFYFSSKLYLNKFTANIKDYIFNENAKIKTKYNLDIVMDIYFMISYYKKVEKRGFRIYDEVSKKEIFENQGFIASLV